MKITVIYDSLHGNTEKIAVAIVGALGLPDDVRALRAGDAGAKDLQEADLAVVGSPTHGFRATEAVQALIRSIPGNGLEGVRVAAFDTRIPEKEVGRGLRVLMKVGGYAAGRIADALEKKGGIPAVPAEGFLVSGREGPLVEGELERAAGWVKSILEAFSAGR
ncbi:MAG: flavodoxin family protein [Dehalococcoidia bacterium]|nr:flavodoxin family protein [Dehalococcoidia bacterium]